MRSLEKVMEKLRNVFEKVYSYLSNPDHPVVAEMTEKSCKLLIEEIAVTEKVPKELVQNIIEIIRFKSDEVYGIVQYINGVV